MVMGCFSMLGLLSTAAGRFCSLGSRENMGKSGKKQRHHHRPPRDSYFLREEDDETFISSSGATNIEDDKEDDEEVQEEDGADPNPWSDDMPSKFLLYQQSVQSPKGDISYLQKFFLMYVGGRVPLHLQEDFCGTALLSTEWLRSDPRRTAVGLDLDVEALDWCMENNMNKIGADGYSRIYLFHGNVLQPLEAKLVKPQLVDAIRNITLEAGPADSGTVPLESNIKGYPNASTNGEIVKRNFPLPARDIVCAFNYSCCCLHKRGELVLYFKHVLDVLSKKGGIFAMDLYGGTSAECKLRLQRKFPNFTYFWEQAEFDIIQRKTRISLHFHLLKQQRKLRHAFSYNWRLWSLPEIKDCLEEAGFHSVHFWIRQMPDTEENRSTEGFGIGRDVKYEEAASFEQQDAWNAYIVGVVK